MLHRPFAHVVTLLLLFTAGSVWSQQQPTPAITDTSRRIIHLDSYEPTPGDMYTLAINYGISFDTGSVAQTENISLLLNADYTIDVPFVGAVNARNLSYEELRDLVTTRVREKSYAQFVSLNLTAPAIFDVFIWGGVSNPGYHTLTSLTRLESAVETAGLMATGSSRTVELLRDGRTTSYDLVSYAVRGHAEENPFIRPGDQIRVPLAAASVELRGAVARPGRIEILPGETIGDLIDLAGGLLPVAQIEKAGLTRIGGDNRYGIQSMSDIDIATVPARNGDIITIPASTTSTELVQVEGAIYTTPAEEGTPRAIPLQPTLLVVPFTPGLTVLTLLEALGGPTPFAETERAFVIRSDSGDRTPIPDLGQLWEERLWERDVVLGPGDRLVIPMMRLDVTVAGQVNIPGSFAFTSGYVVSDYVALAGGVVEQDGSGSRVYFANADGSKSRVDAETPVPIGANIYVGRSTWGEAKRLFENIFVVTGWATNLIGVATVVIEFIARF